jgi:chemotaxis protein CheD
VLHEFGSFYHIGSRNITVALNILEQQGVRVVAQSTGGQQGRKLSFDSGTGEVLMRFIAKRAEPDMVTVP